VLLIFSYILNGFYRSTTGWFSSRQLMAGRAAMPFWIATILLGTLVPMAISLQTLLVAREASAGLMIFAVAAHTCGAFGLKYCILKVGYYEPILPKAKILGKHV
jgi:formate-dependent nitrite reductase membrane component NrfD